MMIKKSNPDNNVKKKTSMVIFFHLLLIPMKGLLTVCAQLHGIRQTFILTCSWTVEEGAV